MADTNIKTSEINNGTSFITRFGLNTGIPVEDPDFKPSMHFFLKSRLNVMITFFPLGKNPVKHNLNHYTFFIN